MHAISSGCGTSAWLAALLSPLTATGHEFVATATFAEGQAVLIDGAHGVEAAPGVQLRHADIIHIGPKGFAQVKIGDGGVRAALIRNMEHHPEWNAAPGR